VSVDLARDGAIYTITINRPEALNALNTRVLSELDEVLDEIVADEDASVVIVTGAGNKAFVAGADIAEMRDMGPDEAHAFGRKGQAVFNRLATLPQPTIAAVNGFALGGGCELALACDMRIASDNAAFGEPEVGLGIIPGFAGTQRLPRLVGSAKALEMILTGQSIGATEALASGLVNRVVPAGELQQEVLRVARLIAANGSHAVRLAKQAIVAATNTSFDAGCEVETCLFAESFDEEQRERMTAFLEKRSKK
jgi:enoyl-CoA hydratase